MPKTNRKLSDLDEKMLFDLVYEGMSDSDIAFKYSISKTKLRSTKNNKVWKAEEGRLWDEIFAPLIFTRN